MIIANPIYDVVFKQLMENERVAKFFIGTLLNETVETLELKPQEFTYESNIDIIDPKILKALEAKVVERLSIRVYRLDFVATIKKSDGIYKKVLIEIQKANNHVDLMRFRNYLGERYKKQEIVNEVPIVLPITTIYILGFNLPEIDTPCLKIERNYKDLINKKIISSKSDFIENLTHDSFIVQVGRIKDNYATSLDKLLSIFEQANFVDDNKITKLYNHYPDLEIVALMTAILHKSGTDPVEKKKIEIEQEALRTMEAIYNDLMVTLKNNAIALQEKDQELSKNKIALNEKDQEIAALKKALANKK